MDVIKSILCRISNYGLEGKQNLIIRFHNNAEDKEIFSDKEEKFTTIAIQNNAQDLQCTGEEFSLNVNINGQNKRLTVPFDSIALIMDPSARFGIEFGEIYDDYRQTTITDQYKMTMDNLNVKIEEEEEIQELLEKNKNLMIFDQNYSSKTGKKAGKNPLDSRNSKGNQYQKDYLSIMRYHMIIVMKNILEHVAEHKLQKNQVLIIEFRRNFPGVYLPLAITQNMTKSDEICSIILQYEFLNLLINRDNFSVILSFQGHLHKIIIPFKSIHRIMDHLNSFKIDMSFMDFIDEHLFEREQEKLIVHDFTQEEPEEI
jgi:hypothetical protein